MAGSIAGGGEGIADAVTGGLASKNAVENNRLISRLGWQLIKPSELAPGMLPVTPELIASTILVENIGIDANTAKEFVNGLTPEQMLELNKLGVDIKEGAYSPAYQQALLDFYRKNGYQTTIATDPNELPKLEGYPIPESTKPKIIGTPLPDQEKETGRFETPILEQDKNSDILPGTEINVGDWRDNILNAENGDPAFKNGYVWKPNVDVDLRGTGKTFQDALDEAFKRTGHNKSEFIPVRWSKTSDGKSIPVQYNGPNGATINVDIGHTGSHSLGVPHIGYKVGKKDKIVGHILLDNVPANRYPGQPLEK